MNMAEERRQRVLSFLRKDGKRCPSYFVAINIKLRQRFVDKALWELKRKGLVVHTQDAHGVSLWQVVTD